MRKVIVTEAIGPATLDLIEVMDGGGTTPTYELERVVKRDDGRHGARVRYGRPGFSNRDEALEFGREWCSSVGNPPT